MRISLLAAALVCLALPASADWNVTDFGAKGDGATDNTAAFQKALDTAAKAGGGVVNVPAGYFRINGNISIGQSVTLQGTHRTPPVAWPDGKPGDGQGSVLQAYAGRGNENGEPFIRLAGNAATVAGVVVSYPEVNTHVVPPVPYPPCIAAGQTDNVAVIDCNLLNPYEGIHFQGTGRFMVRNVYGYPIKRGLFVDECYDIGRVENVHYWPFGVAFNTDDPYCHWINVNGVAFEFARTDWQYVTNTFCFGYGIGYKFSEYANGGCNGNFLGIAADSTERPVVVEQAAEPGLLITNGEFVGRWGSTKAVCVEIGPKVRGKVSMVNCSFWGPIDRCVWSRSAAGQFTASACNFLEWDSSSHNQPCIQLDAGRAIIQGCTFAQAGKHVDVEGKVRSAIIMGNQATGGLNVTNHAGPRAQCALNETAEDVIPASARGGYTLDAGTVDDAAYMLGWQGSEQQPEGPRDRTMRWSKPGAAIRLPVLPGKPYKVSLALTIPSNALQPGAGVYANGRKIAAFAKDGAQTVSGVLPPCKTGSVTLQIRCRAWVPRQEVKGSQDTRILGVSLYNVRMEATHK